MFLLLVEHLIKMTLLNRNFVCKRIFLIHSEHAFLKQKVNFLFVLPRPVEMPYPTFFKIQSL
jgi:hypothetical protein